MNCETIEHPAQGVEYLLIENPDYVAATEGYTLVKDKLLKWTWTGGDSGGTPQSPVENPLGWSQSGETNDKKGRDNPDEVIQTGKSGKSNYFYYQTQTEFVPGVEAVGDPTIEVKNPEYVPAWTEQVVCTPPVIDEPTSNPAPEGPTDEGSEPENEEPPVEEDEVETPAEETISEEEGAVKDSPAKQQTTETIQQVQTPPPAPLAETGGVDFTGIVLLAALLLTGGVTLMRKAVAR